MKMLTHPFRLSLIHKPDKCCEVTCPRCTAGMNLEWTTEYRDPQDGDYEIKCINCNATLGLRVRTTTKIEVSYE
jgi:hypothetical protein